MLWYISFFFWFSEFAYNICNNICNNNMNRMWFQSYCPCALRICTYISIVICNTIYWTSISSVEHVPGLILRKILRLFYLAAERPVGFTDPCSCSTAFSFSMLIYINLYCHFSIVYWTSNLSVRRVKGLILRKILRLFLLGRRKKSVGFKDPCSRSTVFSLRHADL